MGIQINWTDFNTAAPDGFKIYRSLAPINPASPPAPLATVGPAIRTYDDTATSRNTVYYYRVSAFDAASGEVFSPDIVTGYYPYTGPGPQQLLRGDFSSGFFGEIPIADLFTPAELRALVFPTIAADNLATVWLKFACNGKILFTPDRHIGLNASFNTLYANGLVYSGIPQAQWPTQATLEGRGVVAQNKVVQKGEDEFYVRLPGTRKSRISNSATPADHYGGEWDTGIAPLFYNNADPQYARQLHGATYALTANSVATGDFNGVYMLYRTISNAGAIAPVGSVVGTYATNMLWHPVLELIL